jgi:hypothetical protein
MADYAITDCGGLELLAQACAAASRIESLAAAVDRDGPILYGKGGPREHPALKAELANRAFLVRTLQKLGLNFEALRSSPGRPPGGWA